MHGNDQFETKICDKCGFKINIPYSKICPNCKCEMKIDKVTPETNSHSKFLENIITQSNKKKKEIKFKTIKPKPNFKVNNINKNSSNNSQFAKMLKIGSKKDVTFSSSTQSKRNKSYNIKSMTISKRKIAKIDSRIKIKNKQKDVFNTKNIKIELGENEEYLKFMGITTNERLEIYASNKRFKYFLELGSNLEFIATSILSGDLDRMQLSSIDGGEAKEICYFFSHKKFLFLIYGKFPDKKANWLLNQMKTNFYDLLGKKSITNLSKIDLYNLSLNFHKRVKFMVNEYIKFQSVFSSKKIKSLDDFLRVDYFGLSYQSIGVISKLISNELEIEELPTIDSNNPNQYEEKRELAEALITAKMQAIAANTVANTTMMPEWIAVKLGFQHYKFLMFSKIRDYYISLLVEGNLDLSEEILNKLRKLVDDQTKKPFVGVLSEFIKIEPKIIEFLNANNS